MTLYFFFWHFIPCNRLRYGIKSFLKKFPMHNYIYQGMENFLTEYKKYTNLHFFGNMKYEDYLCLLDSATI